MTGGNDGDCAGEIIGAVPPGEDPVAYDRLRRRILWALPTGLYVLGTAAGGRRNLMTTSWVTQVATRPKLVAASVETEAVTRALVDDGRGFALTLLPRAERQLVRRFVKPVPPGEVEIDDDNGAGTMRGEPVVPAPSGAPVLAGAAAWLDCGLRERLELGSHVLFVGEVLACGLGAPGGGATGPGAGSSGAADDGLAELLRMEDTRMSYGG